MDSSSSCDESNSKKCFRCTIEGCKASFSNNSKLTFHIRKHTGERPFACDEPDCDKTYTNSSHLRRHKNVFHGEKQSQTVMCEYEGCGLILANKYSLKKHHNRKHNSDNYSFICAECSQGFHRKKQLQQHVYLHTGEAPFKCDECDIGFTTNRNLNRHKRSHRTYTCDCGETFNRWSLILSHKKICNKPQFKCETCDKLFSHLGNYKNHQLTHVNTTSRPSFICPYPGCKRIYLYKKNLKYHICEFHKKINDNIRYKCTYPRCEILLKTKQSLKMHLQRHFKWVKKKQRRTRRDKGKPKKAMVNALTGIDELVRNNADVDNKESDTEGNQIIISENITDEILLKQCDIAVTLLKEQLIAATS